MAELKDIVRQWLESGRVDLFLGYKEVAGHPLPYAFSKDNLEEVAELVVSPARYSLEKLAASLLKERPDLKIGLLARDCTRRAVNVLAIYNQVEPDQVELLDLTCCPSRPQASCSALTPPEVGEVKRAVGIDNRLTPEQFEAIPAAERLGRWLYEFQKCLKCYGCRDICPVCFCRECSLEHGELVEPRDLPPEVPMFHWVRAVHMAGRCIDCGLCEEACPVDIPLRLLYRQTNKIVRELFGYDTGLTLAQPPFSVLGVGPAEPKEAVAGGGK